VRRRRYPGLVKKKIFISGILLFLAGVCGLEAEDFFFDSAGVRIHYTVEGKGEPVVLIHGFAVDIAWNWGDPGIIKGLEDHYQVIAIDNRGHGRSDKPHDPKKYGVNMVSDVTRLLDHLNIKKAHIVGYSMGGRIASVFLTSHPDRVRTAILGATPWVNADSLPARVVWANQLAESLEQGKGIAPLIIRLTPRGEQPPNAEQMEAINKTFMERNDVLALAAATRGTAGLQPSEAKLRANKLPVLAVVGERDPIKAEVDSLVGVLGNVKLVVILGANHMNAPGRPEFLDALKTFLGAHGDK
jgi:pimeloyl-ACP methyl ester carboxylesterase